MGAGNAFFFAWYLGLYLVLTNWMRVICSLLIGCEPDARTRYFFTR
jgi:hypothetical protein